MTAPRAPAPRRFRRVREGEVGVGVGIASFAATGVLARIAEPLAWVAGALGVILVLAFVAAAFIRRPDPAKRLGRLLMILKAPRDQTPELWRTETENEARSGIENEAQSGIEAKKG